jgi:hypothetical protein
MKTPSGSSEPSTKAMIRWKMRKNAPDGRPGPIVRNRPNTQVTFRTLRANGVRPAVVKNNVMPGDF